MSFLETVIIFSVIIFLAYFIQAITGFAGALFSVPLLALFFDIKFVVPVSSIITLLAGFSLLPSIKIKKHIDKKELLFVFGGAVIGTAIGTYFLKSFTSETLKIIFAIVVIIFALRMIFEKYFSFKKIKSYFGVIFGTLGGITGGMFSTSGPPFVLYLGNQIKNKRVLRGTLISVLLSISIWRNGLYFFSGMFNSQIYKITALMIPVLIIAAILGSKVHLKISESFYRKLIGIILVLSGVLLIF